MQNHFPMCCWKLSPTERVYLAWHETQANFLLVNQGKKSFVECLRSIRLSILPSMALCGNKSLPSQGYIDLVTQRTRDCVLWLVTGCAQKRCFTGASTDSRETGDYEGREANCSLPLSRIQRKSLTTTLWGDQMKEILWTNYCSSSGTSLRLKAHYHLKPNQQKAKEKQKINK